MSMSSCTLAVVFLFYVKARIFLLLDLRDFFFRFRVGDGEQKKKGSENDQSTGH